MEDKVFWQNPGPGTDKYVKHVYGLLFANFSGRVQKFSHGEACTSSSSSTMMMPTTDEDRPISPYAFQAQKKNSWVTPGPFLVDYTFAFSSYALFGLTEMECAGGMPSKPDDKKTYKRNTDLQQPRKVPLEKVIVFTFIIIYLWIKFISNNFAGMWKIQQSCYGKAGWCGHKVQMPIGGACRPFVTEGRGYKPIKTSCREFTKQGRCPGGEPQTVIIRWYLDFELYMS